jgi:HPt (histidine-containing phosphotransfer) domain-containing protein
MDGVETVRQIRMLGNGDDYFRNLPIIALTANAISGIKDMFLQNGFNGFLAKPIDTAKLEGILGKWIPKEKQKSPRPNENDDAEKKEQSASAEDLIIEGVDTKKGLALTGRSKERYLRILDVFYEDGLEKMKELKICLETNDIPTYTILIHALKSATINIGAVELSEAARELETAGKQNDLGFIEAHTAEFFESLELLLKNIYAVLSARKSGNREEEKVSIGTEALKNKFLEIKSALEILDVGSLKRLFDDLQKLKLPENINAVVQSMSRNVLMAEYNGALVLAESVINNPSHTINGAK